MPSPQGARRGTRLSNAVMGKVAATAAAGATAGRGMEELQEYCNNLQQMMAEAIARADAQELELQQLRATVQQLQAVVDVLRRPAAATPTAIAVHGPAGMLGQLRAMMGALTGCDPGSILEVQQVTRADPPPPAGSTSAAVADPGNRRHVYKVTFTSKGLADTALRRRADLRTIRSGAYQQCWLDRWLSQQQREVRIQQRPLARQLSQYGIRFQWGPEEQLLYWSSTARAYAPATQEAVQEACRGRTRRQPRVPATAAAAAAVAAVAETPATGAGAATPAAVAAAPTPAGATTADVAPPAAAAGTDPPGETAPAAATASATAAAAVAAKTTAAPAAAAGPAPAAPAASSGSSRGRSSSRRPAVRSTAETTAPPPRTAAAKAAAPANPPAQDTARTRGPDQTRSKTPPPARRTTNP